MKGFRLVGTSALLLAAVHGSKHQNLDFTADSSLSGPVTFGSDGAAVNYVKMETGGDSAYLSHADNAGVFADGAAVAYALSEIDAVLEVASSGLRAVASSYDNEASEVERTRCHMASGDMFALDSYNSATSGKVPRIQNQLRELAINVKLGHIGCKAFDQFTARLGECIDHLPGRHSNLKQRVARDVAMVAAVVARNVPGTTSATIAGKTVDFKQTGASNANEYAENAAFIQGGLIYDRMAASMPAIDSSHVTALQSAFGAQNCASGSATAILSIANFNDFEKFALQVALSGKAGSCGTDFAAMVDKINEKDANGANAFGLTATELQTRNLNYARMLRAVEAIKEDAEALKAKNDKMMYIALIIVAAIAGSAAQMMTWKQFDKLE